MIDFKTGKKKYKISTIRIRDFYAIRSALLVKHEELAYDLVSSLSGCPIEDLKELNPVQFLEIWSSLEVMLEKNVTQNLEARTKITHEGVEYGLVNFDDLSIGEFADLDLLLNDPQFENRLHEVLAILYRPITRSNLIRYEVAEYDTKDFKDRCQKFLDLPVRHAKAVMSFFLSSAIASSGLTKVYSDLNKTQKKEFQENLIAILTGRGTQHSFIWLMKTLWTSTGQADSELEKHLISLFGEESKSENKTKDLVAWLNKIVKSHDHVS